MPHFTPVSMHSSFPPGFVIGVGLGLAIACALEGSAVGFAIGCIFAAWGLSDLIETSRRNAGAKRLAEQQQGEGFEG